jgi:hypothetical protein
MSTRDTGVQDKTYSFCGVTEGYEEFKWVYFVKLTSSDFMDTGICVKECPEPKQSAGDIKDFVMGGQ